MGAGNRKRPSPGTAYERALADQGYSLVAGLDEAGRGCLAGPVVAAAVVLDLSGRIGGLNDSKALAPAERERLAGLIRRRALAVSVCAVPNEEIDRVNILQATQQAMRSAVGGLEPRAEALLVDGMRLPGVELPQRGIAEGDKVCASIAAASIVAKVHRDALMRDLHEDYPIYNFASNKGYGTAEHRAALASHGPCRLHRLTFRGVRDPNLPFEGAARAGS